MLHGVVRKYRLPRQQAGLLRVDEAVITIIVWHVCQSQRSFVLLYKNDVRSSKASLRVVPNEALIFRVLPKVSVFPEKKTFREKSKFFTPGKTGL